MVAMAEEAPAEAAAAAAAPQRKSGRPDRQAVMAASEAAKEEIQRLQTRIAQIKAQLETTKSSRYAQSPELVEARNTLAVMNAQFAEEVEAKRLIKAELEAADKAREADRSEARAFREKMPFTTMDRAETEIKLLETRMQHTSMAIKDERAAVAQLKNLKRAKDLIPVYDQQMAAIGKGQEERSAKVASVKQKDELLTNLKAEINKQKKAIDAIRQADAAKAVDAAALAAERNAAYDRIRALREETDAKWDEFREKRKEFTAKMELAKEKRAAAQAEWREREEIRRKNDEENYVEKFTDEIILCDQLEAYLQKLTPVESVEKGSDPSSVEVPSVEGFGTMLPSKKKRDDDESWFMGKTKEGKGKKGKGSIPVARERKEKLCLSLDAMASFGKIGLVPPATIGDASKTIETLKAKKEEFVKLQAEAKEAREKAKIEAVGEKVETEAKVEAAGESEAKKEEVAEIEMPKVDSALLEEEAAIAVAAA